MTSTGYKKIAIAGKALLLSALICGSMMLAPAMALQDTVHANEYEQDLFVILEDIRSGHVARARQQLARLLEKNPRFKLAQLVYADLLRAHVSALDSVGAVGDNETTQQQALRDEMQKRWQHYTNHDVTEIPSYLLDLGDSYKHVVVVDTAGSRLYLYGNDKGRLSLVNDYYVSIGLAGANKLRQGDKRTPIGVYFVDGFIAPEKLPDLYGAGAFPINYPNEWDQRLGKTGYGIWLHGTPSYTFNRPPQASDGCVTLSNYDFNHLSSFVDVGNTPVIIANGIEWGDQISISKQRQAFYTLLEQWRADWESRNIERFLSNYSSDFNSQGKDFKAWAENARLAYADAGEIRIRLSNVSVFAYPDQNLLVTTFRQEYHSDNTRLNLLKRQYWKQDNQGQWKIVYEGSV